MVYPVVEGNRQRRILIREHAAIAGKIIEKSLVVVIREQHLRATYDVGRKENDCDRDK
jgi:hypothetical protein